jgi:hypothetical protein
MGLILSFFFPYLINGYIYSYFTLYYDWKVIAIARSAPLLVIAKPKDEN